MGVASAANTAIPLSLGKLIDSVDPQRHQGLTQASLLRTAAFYLAIMGLAYLVREVGNVLRRYLVENVCTRIDRDMCVRLVAHLMKADLSVLAQQQVGALHGRIARSVEGVVRFFRISFLDFIPALISGSFALTAALSRQPKVALAMAGVIPLSLGLTIWQLMTQKGIGSACSGAGKRWMEPSSSSFRVSTTYAAATRTSWRSSGSRRRPNGGERRSSGTTSKCRYSGAARRLNEGFFHLVVIACAIYLFVSGHIAYGDVFALSVLFLQVMAPLNEVHRFIDEAQESSLRMGDLLEILDAPTDDLIQTRRRHHARPGLGCAAPGCGRSPGRLPYVGRQVEAWAGWSLGDDPARRDDRRGGSFRVRQVDLAPRAHATDPPVQWKRLAGGVPIASITREAIGDLIGYVGQNPFIFSGTIADNSPTAAKMPPRARSAARRRWPASTTRSSTCTVVTRARCRTRPEPLRRSAPADRPRPRFPQEPTNPDP